MNIQVHCIGRLAWKSPFAIREYVPLLYGMRSALGCAHAPALELALVDDLTIARYNSEFLGCPGPTNILSFPDLPGAPRFQGDSSSGGGGVASLILSLDTLHRECLLYGQEPGGHCIRLLSHGLVHTLGHDHGPAMDALAATAHTTALALLAQRQQP